MLPAWWPKWWDGPLAEIVREVAHYLGELVARGLLQESESPPTAAVTGATHPPE